MADEKGDDAKVLAVPDDNVLVTYSHWRKHDDINPHRLYQIQHFFEHYKDLEPGKWVKVDGWGGVDDAKAEIGAGMKRYKK
jgi:inorganic pyrophosphatase